MTLDALQTSEVLVGSMSSLKTMSIPQFDSDNNGRDCNRKLRDNSFGGVRNPLIQEFVRLRNPES